MGTEECEVACRRQNGVDRRVNGDMGKAAISVPHTGPCRQTVVD